MIRVFRAIRAVYNVGATLYEAWQDAWYETKQRWGR